MEKSIRGQKRFIVLEARNEGVKFTVASLRCLSDEFKQLQGQYNQMQDRFAKEVIEIAGTTYSSYIVVYLLLLIHVEYLTLIAVDMVDNFVYY